VQPGDLLLMAGDETEVTTPLGHIGIAIGGGLMIQASYTGADVELSPGPRTALEVVRRVIAT
jgi:cell wall-associated NlpC family hydrolase